MAEPQRLDDQLDEHYTDMADTDTCGRATTVTEACVADQGPKPDITQIALGNTKPSPRQTLH